MSSPSRGPAEAGTTVGLLRLAGDPDSPLEPAPGLAQLPGLAASFRAARLAVTTTDGEPRPLSAWTDVAAYRITQEALTNVTKHARRQRSQGSGGCRSPAAWDNSAVAADYDGTGAFRGASFTGADFTGASFRDCDLRQVKITDSWLVDVSLSGLVGHLVVNDVDVTAFVDGELDRRHPERVQLRKKRTAGDYRAMWDTIERLWAETVARAGRLPEPALHQRVDGEWSFIETLRHLVLATDKWAGYMILDNPMPYHPLGLPQPGCTPADAAAPGIDPGVRPPLAAVLEVRGTRMALVRGIVDGLTDDDLQRVCPRLPAPGYPQEARSVGLCLGVVMKEECEHRRYAVRDLAVLEADPGAGAAHRDAPPR